MSDGTPRDFLGDLASEYTPPTTPPGAVPGANGHGGTNGHPRRLGDVSTSEAVKRCRAYLAKLPGGVEGDHGSDRTIQAARIIWNDFGIDEPAGWDLFVEWNQSCVPPWPVEGGSQTLARKWTEATKKGAGPEGRGFKLLEDRPGYGPRSSPNGTPHANGAANGTGGTPAGESRDKSPTARDWKTFFIDTAELSRRDCKLDWAVKRWMVWGQSAVIAGPPKSLKTTFAVALAFSVATGKPFLGRFDVGTPGRVAILSAESGEATLKNTAHRVCDSMGLTMEEVGDRVVWAFRVPQLGDLSDLKALVEVLVARQVRMIVVDPLYLSLLTGSGPDGPDARNLFQMGSTLLAAAAVFTEAGITPVLCHHANKGVQLGEPMDLQHLAYSGCAEATRQWILINRRAPYEGDGEHKLWLNVGGSAGQGGLWAAHINEGTLDEDFGGREWNVVSVESASTAREAERERKAERRATEKAARTMQEDAKVLKVIDGAGSNGATRGQIRARTGLSDPKVKEALARLIDRRRIEESEVTVRSGKGRSQVTTAYRSAPEVG